MNVTKNNNVTYAAMHSQHGQRKTKLDRLIGRGLYDTVKLSHLNVKNLNFKVKFKMKNEQAKMQFFLLFLLFFHLYKVCTAVWSASQSTNINVHYLISFIQTDSKYKTPLLQCYRVYTLHYTVRIIQTLQCIPAAVCTYIYIYML